MSVALSARDMQVLGMAWKCFSDPANIRVDYEKLATLGGYSNARSASAAFSAIKKRLLAASDSALAAESTNSKTTPKNTPKKAKTITGAVATPDIHEADDEATTPATNTPLGKKKGGRKAKAVVVDDDADDVVALVDDYEEVATPSKKRVRKSNVTTPVKRAKVEEGGEEKGKGVQAGYGAEGGIGGGGNLKLETETEIGVGGGLVNGDEEEEEGGEVAMRDGDVV